MLEKNGIYFCEIFQPFQGEIFHAFSSKKTGSLRKEDEENRKNFCDDLQLPHQEWRYVRQSHSDKIVIDGPEGDAIITTESNKVLAINTADCQAVLLFDPVRKVVANVHNGWRGSAQKIVSKTLQKMQTDFGSNPNDILAAVSPALGPCCAYFTDPLQELPQFLHRYILPDQHSVDFWQCTKDELLAAGLKINNVELAEICTKCKSDLFFSYRADKENPGRMVSLIQLL